MDAVMERIKTNVTDFKFFIRRICNSKSHQCFHDRYADGADKDGCSGF